MKKISLLSTLLLAVSHTAVAQSPNLNPFFWKANESSSLQAQDRSGFPVLLTDSVYCDFYYYQFPYELQQEIFDSYEYDNQERVIKYNHRSDILPDIGNWNHTTYTYDAQGRVVASLTVTEVGPGLLQNSQKTEKTFSPDGTTSEEKFYNWDNVVAWILSSRTLIEYDAQGRAIQELRQQWNSPAWTNSYRYTYAWDANGNQILYRVEGWDVGTNTWYIAQESARVYSNDGKLLSVVGGYGSLLTPFQLSSKWEYHYDAQGRNDYTDRYDWDEIQAQWVAIGKDVNTFNAQNELVQTVQNSLVSQVLVPYARTLYTYGEGIYTDQAEERLYQVLAQGTFKDEERTISDFWDLPNGQVGQAFEIANQDPPGSVDWRRRFGCNVYYHISTVSSTGQPDKPAPCLAPNPYRAGTRVNCSGLKDNYSYMLWVYSLDGRVSYARQFNGAEGWSIERQLPTGAYLVVVTHNGKQISAQKIVLE